MSEEVESDSQVRMIKYRRDQVTCLNVKDLKSEVKSTLSFAGSSGDSRDLETVMEFR